MTSLRGELAGHGLNAAAINRVLEPDKAKRKLGPGLDSDAEDLLPRKARGDYREKTVTAFFRDAIDGPERGKEKDLIETRFDEHEQLGTEAARRLGQAFRSSYVVETTRRTRLLSPIHSGIAAQWTFKGSFKMYNGVLLTFLSRMENGAPDRELLERFFALFNGDEGLTLLDREMLKLAGAQTPGPASAEHLIEARKVSPIVGVPATHELFRRDLNTVLCLQGLGRRDKVHSVLTVLYFHIALHYWRIGWVLEEQVKEFSAWVQSDPLAVDALERACDGSVEGSLFRGQLRFRIATSTSRPIRHASEAAVSYRLIDEQRLLTLPANLTVLKRTRWAASELGIVTPAVPSFAQIASSCSDAERAALDGVLRALAKHEASELTGDALTDISMAIDQAASGVEALQRALVGANRRQLPDLGRDITAQVMKRGGKGLVATRGNVNFFEMGQDLLVLLTKMVTRDERIRYSTFLQRIADYGLQPQDRFEVERLSEAMRSMQLLEKHSDSGEAMYVSHFL